MGAAQDGIKAKLGELGIPYRLIEVYGSQIVIECHSQGACERFRNVVSLFATIRGLIKARVDAKVNKGTCLLPTTIIVWRLYARI